MSVWLTIPSARPAIEIGPRIAKWRRQGYMIALWRNGPHWNEEIDADYVIYSKSYAGWGQSINRLIIDISAAFKDAEWFVGGGDDTDPDVSKIADRIERECERHFSIGPQSTPVEVRPICCHPSFGVMQPTGDRWGESEPWARATFPDAPAYIDRICGSPWIGREFARRMNQGKGPFWPEFYHMFADECLCEVAKKLGVLWQRRDLIHYHDHCRRDGIARTPEFLKEAYSKEEWDKSKAIFERLKANGFAECLELIP